MSPATKTETPLQARISAVIGRLRLIEAQAARLRPECGEVIEELTRIYRDLGDASVVERPAASIHNLREGNRIRHERKQRDGQRRCTHHANGSGAWLPVSAFDVKNPATGALRSWCRECTLAYQRERYVSVSAKTMTVQLIEGDRCIGHDCPVCGLPMEIGDKVRGENLHHDSCAVLEKSHALTQPRESKTPIGGPTHER